MRPTLPALTALLLTITPAAKAETTGADQPWSATVSGGVSDYSGDKARAFGSLSLSRDVGDWSLGLAASVINSGESRRSTGAIPSTTRQLILSAGRSFGSVSVDAHGAIGRRRFDNAAIARASGASITLASKGDSASAGLTVTDDIAIGKAVFFSPFASIDYSRVDVARVVTLPNRVFVLDEHESGVTGAAGATLIAAFGPGERHNVGLYVAALTTSNDAASSIGLRGTTAAPRSLEGNGGKDSWFEAGPTASVGLTRSLHLDLAATRTFGLNAGNGTTGSAALRLAF